MLGNANEAGLVAALIWFWTSASDFPAAANQACATSFFTCTRMMPAFSGPLTLPKRVRKSSSPLAEFAVDDHHGFGAVVAGVDGFGDQRRRAA